MYNPELGRMVLDVADHDPEHFDMDKWGFPDPGGPVACIGGWALLKAGYRLVATGTYIRPDGTEVSFIAMEAERVLGMAHEETDKEAALPIWYDYSNGVARFRALVEQAEAARLGH